VTTVEVPREAWLRQLNELTRTHEGWLTYIEVFGNDIGAQPEITGLPLIGMSADRIDHDGTIAVSVARWSDGHFTHVVRDAKRVFLEQAAGHGMTVVFIEARDGTRTVVQLRAPAEA
jgi:hypothetical protein